MNKNSQNFTRLILGLEHWNGYHPIQWRIQDFPDGDTNFQGGGTDLLFCQMFHKNCMKTKEFLPRGGRDFLTSPLRSANVNVSLGDLGSGGGGQAHSPIPYVQCFFSI